MEEILLQLDDVAFQIASRSELTYHDLDIRTERSKGFLPDPRFLICPHPLSSHRNPFSLYFSHFCFSPAELYYPTSSMALPSSIFTSTIFTIIIILFIYILFLFLFRQALKNPDAPCVVETDKTYTYKVITYLFSIFYFLFFIYLFYFRKLTKLLRKWLVF